MDGQYRLHDGYYHLPSQEAAQLRDSDSCSNVEWWYISIFAFGYLTFV
jgi:hypothetical protein